MRLCCGSQAQRAFSLCEIWLTAFAGNSVSHHLMGSYQRSLLAIMLAQFTRKRFAGGMAGVVRLASRSITVQVS